MYANMWCDVHSTCIDTDGSYICYCDYGYVTDVENMHECLDVNECEDSSSCESWETCTNSVGSYSCDNPCIDGEFGFPCHEYAYCTNKDSEGGYECNCLEDMIGDGYNNCTQTYPCDSNPCFENAYCTNTNEGYECNCNDGYDYVDVGTCQPYSKYIPLF